MYFKGDKVKLTGNTTKACGTKWAEFIYLEGHKKGQKGDPDRRHMDVHDLLHKALAGLDRRPHKKNIANGNQDEEAGNCKNFTEHNEERGSKNSIQKTKKNKTKQNER